MKIKEPVNWPFLGVGIFAFMMMAIFNCSIEGNHVVKREIIFDHGQLKRIVTYDSSFQKIKAQTKIYISIDARYD